MGERTRRRFTTAIAGALFLFALPAGACLGATGTVESHSTLELHPVAISSRMPTPVSLTFSEQLGRSDGAHLSPLQELTIDLDRRLAIDLRGVPRCHVGGQIEVPRGPEADPCPNAKIGSGWVEVEVEFPEQPPIPVAARLIVYNGGTYKGVTKLFLRAYFTAPVSGGIVLTAEVRQEAEGRFGSKMTITVPKIAGNGAVTYLRFRLRKGIVTATCPNGHLSARASALLTDGTLLLNRSNRPC